MRFLLPLFVLPVLCFSNGCALSSLISRKSPQLDTSLLEAQGYSIPPGGMPSTMEEQDSSGEPSIVLEVRGGEKRKARRVPLPVDRGVFIEEIIQQGNLHEHLGRIQASIMRPTAAGNPPIRMVVRFDDEGKATSVGQNYAVLPGDHVIIYEDQRSMLERFISEQFK